MRGWAGEVPTRRSSPPCWGKQTRFRKGHLELLNALPTSFLRCCFRQKPPCPVTPGRVQDKSPAPQAAPGWSQRPAVRTAFRAFTGQGRDSRNCLKLLAGVCFWGHFQAGKPPLASDLPKAHCSGRLVRRLFCHHRHHWQKRTGFSSPSRVRDSIRTLRNLRRCKQ